MVQDWTLATQVAEQVCGNRYSLRANPSTRHRFCTESCAETGLRVLSYGLGLALSNLRCWLLQTRHGTLLAGIGFVTWDIVGGDW
eukprot:2267060-Rhodomonas_salina.1